MNNLKNLVCLRLARNRIRNMKELNKLNGLQHLREMSLKGNPCFEETLSCFNLCLFYIRKLEILDAKHINEWSFKKAATKCNKSYNFTNTHPKNTLMTKMNINEEDLTKLKKEIEELKDAARQKEEHLMVLRKQMTERSIESYLSDVDGFILNEEKASAIELAGIEQVIQEKIKELESKQKVIQVKRAPLPKRHKNYSEEISLHNELKHFAFDKNKTHDSTLKVCQNTKELNKMRRMSHQTVMQKFNQESERTSETLGKVRLSLQLINDINFQSKYNQRTKSSSIQEVSINQSRQTEQVHKINTSQQTIEYKQISKEVAQQVEVKNVEAEQQTILVLMKEVMQQTEQSTKEVNQQTSIIELRDVSQQVEIERDTVKVQTDIKEVKEQYQQTEDNIEIELKEIYNLTNVQCLSSLKEFIKKVLMQKEEMVKREKGLRLELDNARIEINKQRETIIKQEGVITELNKEIEELKVYKGELKSKIATYKKQIEDLQLEVEKVQERVLANTKYSATLSFHHFPNINLQSTIECSSKEPNKKLILKIRNLNSYLDSAINKNTDNSVSEKAINAGRIFNFSWDDVSTLVRNVKRYIKKIKDYKAKLKSAKDYFVKYIEVNKNLEKENKEIIGQNSLEAKTNLIREQYKELKKEKKNLEVIIEDCKRIKKVRMNEIQQLQKQFDLLESEKNNELKAINEDIANTKQILNNLKNEMKNSRNKLIEEKEKVNDLKSTELELREKIANIEMTIIKAEKKFKHTKELKYDKC